ncbi:hypothetical protein DPX16_22425 [Anabarilius grahami]|uniref:Uncharacterized protein n=1 Tax=Anabarilius grahami TaxID=495550 RepID=A0A3N0YYG3_ANAGA|nr:hypothetical protein DPX16_22425 [Anabarilius grahami]
MQLTLRRAIKKDRQRHRKKEQKENRQRKVEKPQYDKEREEERETPRKKGRGEAKVGSTRLVEEVGSKGTVCLLSGQGEWSSCSRAHMALNGPSRPLAVRVRSRTEGQLFRHITS